MLSFHQNKDADTQAASVLKKEKKRISMRD
jgi:hypothetical protein